MLYDMEPIPSNPQLEEPHVKRLRLPGACDTCRRKKIKCNSAEMPNRICSNCITYGLDCTHNTRRHASRKETEKELNRPNSLPTSDNQSSYQALEDRLNKMEQLLRSVRPELDIERSVTSSNTPENVHSVHTPPNANYSHHTPVTDLPYLTPQSLRDPGKFNTSPPAGTEDLADEDDIALSEQLSRLAVDADDRFFGKSSALVLMQHAKTVKHEIIGVDIPQGKNQRRPIFWELHPWEVEHALLDIPQYEFPEKSLLDQLVTFYFDHVNAHIPLLHRPTFEQDLANDLHLHDSGFAQVVLMVCALGSRCSDDPRVTLPNDMTGLSHGFKFFRQTRLMRNKLLDRVSLYDLQYYCLVVPYLLATSRPQAGWSLVGLALRFAQERGVHRRQGDNHKPTVVNELWKRCFWCLISYDRLTSSCTGRSCAIHEEDFDVDLPIECDDEYWECEDPRQNWKQPPGKPCKVTAFILHLRLCEILAFTLRMLYSTKKSKLLTGLMGQQWEQRMVVELDSSMNKWKDSLPDHLRWDPNQPNPLFLRQSAFIHAKYYYVQIQIHRPFILKASSLSFPSLAICTNAARACSHLVNAKRLGWLYPNFNMLIPILASGIILSLHMYGGRRAGLKTDPEKEGKDVKMCMDAIQRMENKSSFAGRMFDILSDLIASHEDMASTSQFISAKRQRDERPSEKQQRQAASPTTSNQSRPRKPLPTRQPNQWPPSPSSSNDNPSVPPKADDIRNHRSGYSSPNQTSVTAHTSIPLNPNSDITQPWHSATSSPPTESTTSARRSNSLDLDHFVLAQMDFGPAPQIFGNSMPQEQMSSNTFASPVGNPMNFPLGGQDNLPTAFPWITEQPLLSNSSMMEYDQNTALNQDMTALWPGAPSDFDINEWERFIANIDEVGYGLGLWSGKAVENDIKAMETFNQDLLEAAFEQFQP